LYFKLKKLSRKDMMINSSGIYIIGSVFSGWTGTDHLD